MFKKLFGGLIDSNEKEIDRIKPIVDKINALEPDFERLSDAELQAKTGEFKSPHHPSSCAEKREEVEKARQELTEKRKCEAEAINDIQAGRAVPRMQRPGKSARKPREGA